jgi:hypothetical protein
MNNSLAERVMLDAPATRNTAALTAGPAALTSVVLGAVASHSAEPLAVATSPLGIASAACALLAVVAVALAAMQTATQRFFARGPRRFAVLVAVIGSVLTSGGYWASVFVLPSLAMIAPDAVVRGLRSVTTGFVISYALMGIGWAWLGVLMVRAHCVGRTGWLLVAAGLICLRPLPFRFLPMAIAVTIALGIAAGRDERTRHPR